MGKSITGTRKRVETIADLYARTDLNQETGCRLWTFSLDTAGYPHVGYKNKHWTVSRLLWTWLHGEIPVGLQVLHNCDRFYPPGDRTNRRCIEETHLRLGTNGDNVRDMVANRRHWAHFKPEVASRGNAHYSHKRAL
jgi:hypothetical protein